MQLDDPLPPLFWRRAITRSPNVFTAMGWPLNSNSAGLSVSTALCSQRWALSDAGPSAENSAGLSVAALGAESGTWLLALSLALGSQRWAPIAGLLVGMELGSQRWAISSKASPALDSQQWALCTGLLVGMGLVSQHWALSSSFQCRAWRLALSTEPGASLSAVGSQKEQNKAIWQRLDG